MSPHAYAGIIYSFYSLIGFPQPLPPSSSPRYKPIPNAVAILRHLKFLLVGPLTPACLKYLSTHHGPRSFCFLDCDCTAYIVLQRPGLNCRRIQHNPHHCYHHTHTLSLYHPTFISVPLTRQQTWCKRRMTLSSSAPAQWACCCPFVCPAGATRSSTSTTVRCRPPLAVLMESSRVPQRSCATLV